MPWTWARATCRGTSHTTSDTPCQDHSHCVALGEGKDILLAVVSDGAGSASHSRHGAILVCRTINTRARAHFRFNTTFPTDDILWSWIDEARDRILHVATIRNIDHRQFAATLICVLTSGPETLVLHIGDGAAVLRTSAEWIVPSWPAMGEYASTTFFVTDDPAPRLQITRTTELVQAVAVFSDGIERLALNFIERRAHFPFFDKMIRPVVSGAVGQNDTLSAALATYLNGEDVNARTDDDKSLILAARV